MVTGDMLWIDGGNEKKIGEYHEKKNIRSSTILWKDMKVERFCFM
jgi:hypothetical protein